MTEPTTYKICEACGYAYRKVPDGVGCVSETHILGNKILRRLYDFMPTRRVEVDGKVLYDVSSDDLFRAIFDLSVAPKRELCEVCQRSIKSDPRDYGCKDPKHLEKYLANHRERMTRYLNNRQHRGSVPTKVLMSHKRVALNDPKLKQIAIHFGARLRWSNPVRQILLFDPDTRLVWGSAAEWTFRSARSSRNPDLKEIVFETANIKLLEVPLTLGDLGFNEDVSLRLFMYVPPKQKEGA